MDGTWKDETGTWEDFTPSPRLPDIRKIIGSGNWRDALHVDSAYKSGCAAIVTVDRDILDHSDALEALLGLRIFHPENDSDDLRRMIFDHGE